jgi:DNA-binding NarL/FixJ family response regulator
VSETVRLLLADDHTLMRAGIRALLEEIDGLVIVAEAENGRDALALARQHRPDLIIMDISMREMSGIEAAAQIRAELPSVRVLFLSMHATEDFVRRAFKAGAAGYIVKDAAPQELRLAIEAILRGEAYVSPRVSKGLLSGLIEGRQGDGELPLDSLTPRQREILQLIAEGKGTKEIAFVLDVSVKTIETHRAALMARLGIWEVAGLVLYAVRHNLVSTERGPR